MHDPPRPLNDLAATAWSRPHLSERPEYLPRSPGERFIVPLLKEWIERGFAEHAPPAGGRVLDVGCGRQPFRKLIEASGLRYRSLDAVQNEDATVDFLAPIDGPLPEPLLAEAPFELVLCTEVLEHVADWPAAFANLRRLTGERGTLLLTCPHYYMLHEEPFDFWRPTEFAIRHYAEQFGFRVQRFERLGRAREVLGTLLGFCTFKPRRLGVWPYLFARSLNVFKRLALAFLRSRRSWAGSVELAGNTYLANFAILTGAGPVASGPARGGA